jgi:hypothetical protein
MPRKAIGDSDGLVSINLSVPRALRARLEEAARASGRTLTAETSRLLELGFHFEDLQKTLEKTLLTAIERVGTKVDHVESSIWRYATADMESLDRPAADTARPPKRSTAAKSGRR